MIVAHVGGMPLEELAPAVAGAGVLLARAALIVRGRVRRGRGLGK